MDSDFKRIKLPNGLQIMLKEIHTAPLVSAWVWYRVGSRQEIPGLTGASHWVEHMQFKGTSHFKPGDLDKAIARLGGYWNAMTYLDWTTYFATMPASAIDLILELEADRMTGTLFKPADVDSERTVILSERQGSENDPSFLLEEQVQAAAFRVHSYRHQVIGEACDLEKMTRDQLYQHYRDHYQPNTAVLAMAGDFKTSEMIKRLKMLFTPIPAATLPEFSSRAEPAPRGERRVEVEGPGDTTFLQVAYLAPPGSARDFFACLVMDSLLTGASSLNMFGGGISNKTSRLYQALVDKDLAVGVSGGLQATIDPYLYNIHITVHPRHKPEQVIKAMDEQISRLQESTAPVEELQRACKQARALFAYGSESITNQAFWLGFAEMFSTYEWFLGYLDQLAAVTPEDVMRVARQYLAPKNRVVGIYRPDGSAGEE